jgi:hypothetical protein
MSIYQRGNVHWYNLARVHKAEEGQGSKANGSRSPYLQRARWASVTSPECAHLVAVRNSRAKTTKPKRAKRRKAKES